MMKCKHVLPLLSLTFLLACLPERDTERDWDAVRDEIKNRKIRRLTDAEIQVGAYKLAQSLEQAAPAQWQCGGPLAIANDSLAAFVKSSRVWCASSTTLAGKEGQVLSNYLGAWKAEKRRLGQNVQRLENENFLLTTSSPADTLAVWVWEVNSQELIRTLSTQ